MIDNKRQKYGFIIPECYPFRGPEILYQGIPYIEFLKLSQPLTEYKLIKKITGNHCFCCHSLNCTNNWSPSITIQKIIEEIKATASRRGIANDLGKFSEKTLYNIKKIHNCDEEICQLKS